jgi:hypothetical protein
MLIAQEIAQTREAPERRGPSRQLWKTRVTLRQNAGNGTAAASYFSAVDTALNWLGSRQESDGSWPRRDDQSSRTTASELTFVVESSAEARFGVTGLAVFAILADGRTRPDSDDGPRTRTLRSALGWLMEHVDEITDLPLSPDRAWGVLALVDAAAHSEDPEIRDAAQRGCRLLAQGPWDPSDQRSWNGACASVLVLTIAWHADLDVDEFAVAALARSPDLLRAAPKNARACPTLYVANLIRPDPLAEQGALGQYFDAQTEAARLPVLGEIAEPVLFDVWHHLACASVRGSSIYRGRFGLKRAWQLIESQDRSGAFSSSLVSAERRTAEAVLVLARPYFLWEFPLDRSSRR